MKNVSLVTLMALVPGIALAHPASPEATLAEHAETCWDEVATLVSISLSRAKHGAPAGSQAEKRAKERLAKFNEHVGSFKAFMTGCNESTSGDARFNCYSRNFFLDTKSIARMGLTMENLERIPACAYIVVTR